VSRLICVVAKEPAPGQAKTRLAKHLGDEAAAALARAFLCDALDLARKVAGAQLAIAYAGDPKTLPSSAEGFSCWPQGEGDLGARMERALRRGLEHAQHVLIIGSDSPGLPVRHLEQAFELLRDHDAVLGPADDGGYYLLGLNRCPEGLLAELPWSAADTAERTLARLCEQRFRVALLDRWFDVDELADLDRLQALLRSGTADAPWTKQALARLAATSLSEASRLRLAWAAASRRG
jgi:rSAM/selenodomain-associated transferase 1